MKRIGIIPYQAIEDHKLTQVTDLLDWAIVDYIRGWSANPRASFMPDPNSSTGGVMVWIDYDTLMSSVPLLHIGTRTGLGRRISNLASLDVIRTTRGVKGRVYAVAAPWLDEYEPGNSGVNPKVDSGVNPKVDADVRSKDVHKKKDSCASTAYTYPDDFKAFWKIYPRGIGKARALKEWLREKEHNPEWGLERVLFATRNYIAENEEHKTKENFVKHPSTFLHAGLWYDYVYTDGDPGADHAPKN